MTSRERPGTTPGTASFASERSALAANGSASEGDFSSLFPTLLPNQQRLLLDAAARNGYVEAGQLPHRNADRLRDMVNAFLADSTDMAAEAPRFDSLRFIDDGLDDRQRRAVAIALATPDLALIAGESGTGKSRVIAEIIRQAAKQGRRVLFTSQSSAALDVVLDQLDADAGVLCVRGLARAEQVEQLSSAARRRTPAEWRRRLSDEVRDRCRRTQESAEGRLVELQAAHAALDRTATLLESLEHQRARTDAVKLRREQLVPEVQRSDDEFGRVLAAEQSAHEDSCRRMEHEETQATAEIDRSQREVAELEARIAIKQNADADRGWMSKLFRRTATRETAQVDQWNRQLNQLRRKMEQARSHADHVSTERRNACSRFAADRATRIKAEADRRRLQIDRELEELERQSRELNAELHESVRTVPECAGLNGRLDSNHVSALRNSLRQTIELAQRDAAAAGLWREAAAENGSSLVDSLSDWSQCVAMPIAGLFEENTPDSCLNQPFDLVIADETHQLSDAELHAVFHRATHAVLVGEPPEATIDPPARSRSAHSREHGSRNGSRVTAVSRATWPMLWSKLHSTSWRIENGRICAQLMHLDPKHCRHLEQEPVADSPDTLVRIWSPTRGRSEIVEVVLPPGATMGSAIRYVHDELRELPATSGPSVIEETDGRIVCRWESDALEEFTELEPGLRVGWTLCDEPRLTALEFSTGFGWTRIRADEWMARTLRFADPGRCSMLRRNYRQCPELAAFRFALGLGTVSSGNALTHAAVDFIPVPALFNEPQARRRGDVAFGGQQRRLPPLRGGAGFEFDLSDQRQRERLPLGCEWAPHSGYLNLVEAEAVVRLLENIIDDGEMRSQHSIASIAVLTMFEAQSRVIRQFSSESRLISESPIPITFADHRTFAQREADLVIVGLTRSHHHRAASYADAVGAFASAIMRARKRLIIVGDPGTLARRTQWNGPLDRLDEAAADAERNWVLALVRLLQGQGPAVVQLREGPP